MANTNLSLQGRTDETDIAKTVATNLELTTVIVDVEATRSIRQAEVGAKRAMLDRVKDKFDLHPERLIANTAYGTGPMLGGLVNRKIAPHILVFYKPGRNDGTWTRADFEWDAETNQCICPEGEELKKFHWNYSDLNRGLTGTGVTSRRGIARTFVRDVVAVAVAVAVGAGIGAVAGLVLGSGTGFRQSSVWWAVLWGAFIGLMLRSLLKPLFDCDRPPSGQYPES